MAHNGSTSKIPVHSLDEFGFNMDRVQLNIGEITRLLNERIEECNNDPRFEHPIYRKEDGYVVIRRINPFPEFHDGMYLWRILYEPGSDGTSSGPTLFYFPNARRKLDFLIENGLANVAEQQEKEWRVRNPDIILEKDLYAVSGRIVSNSYKDALKIIFSMFNTLRESRKRS